MGNNNEISTNVYRISRSGYVKGIISRWISRYWFIPALPVIACLICGAVFNTAFFFIAAMLVFLIFPLLLFFLYFNYMLSPEGVGAIKSHRAIFKEENLTILRAKNYNPEPDDEEEMAVAIDIPIDKLHDIEIGKQNLTFITGKAIPSFFIVPGSAFQSDSDYREIIRRLTKPTIY